MIDPMRIVLAEEALVKPEKVVERVVEVQPSSVQKAYTTKFINVTEKRISSVYTLFDSSVEGKLDTLSILMDTERFSIRIISDYDAVEYNYSDISQYAYQIEGISAFDVTIGERHLYVVAISSISWTFKGMVQVIPHNVIATVVRAVGRYREVVE